MHREDNMNIAYQMQEEMFIIYAEEIKAEEIEYQKECEEREKAYQAEIEAINARLKISLAKEQKRREKIAKELGMNVESLIFNVNAVTGKCKKCKRAEAVFTGNYCKRCYYSY